MAAARSLSGRRVLITGPARGIGAALAEQLARRGARLALVGLESERLANLAARCGDGTFVVRCDVSDSAQVTDAVDRAAAALGGLDAVVANAGIATSGPLRLHDLRSWERLIEINLLGVMYTDRAALPHIERTGGYLLNIASAAAIARAPGMTAYCTAKAGVEALSDCLRVEMQGLGVQVGVAYFMFLDTDMVRDVAREAPAVDRPESRIERLVGRTYPLESAVNELVAAIAHRRRRVAYPRWLLPTLAVRQLFASPLVERLSSKAARESLAAYEQRVAERGAQAASATERTRELVGL